MRAPRSRRAAGVSVRATAHGGRARSRLGPSPPARSEVARQSPPDVPAEAPALGGPGLVAADGVEDVDGERAILGARTPQSRDGVDELPEAIVAGLRPRRGRDDVVDRVGLRALVAVAGQDRVARDALIGRN